MGPILGAALVSVLVFLAELPGMRQGMQIRKKVVCGLLIASAFTLYSLQILHIRVPNPLALVGYIYEQLGLTLGK